MLLSIIVPAYNEEKTLARVIERVLAVDYSLPFEVIIVNDGSTDGTARAARELERKTPGKIKMIDQKINQGKGAAIISGAAQAKGDIVVIQDADLEYDPAQIPKLLKPIINGQAVAVYGSRFLGRISQMSFTHRFGNKMLTWLTNLVFSSRLTDMETCYKAISRKVLAGMELEQKRFGIEVELTAKILRAGHKIMELPIDYEARPKSEGKKIGIGDGLKAAGYILRYRFL